jgi:hypothetical protein
MSAGPKFNLFERFKRLYGLTDESAQETRANRGETALGADLDDAVATAQRALELLGRLKIYTLPAGRIPAARVIAERCAARLLRRECGEPEFESEDPTCILAVLRDIEAELIALGGAPDLLTESVEMVKRTFTGSRLVDVRKTRK